MDGCELEEACRQLPPSLFTEQPTVLDRRRLLDRAQATMRGLHSIRQVEDVTSGPGTFARTTYRLRAPDRLAYLTDRGVQGVTVGARQFVRVPGGTWQETPTAADVPFRTASWFRFTPYATAVRLLAERTAGGRRIGELALMDPGTPVWTQLTVDEARMRKVGALRGRPWH